MALLVSTILTAMSIDSRQLLSPTNDSTIMIDWVNRVNKTVMHSSVYNRLLRATVNVPLTANTNIYSVSFTNLRRVLSAFDNTIKRTLIPVAESVLPASTASPGQPQGPPQGEGPGIPWPKYFAQYGTSGFAVWPAPPVASSLGVDVIYEQTTTNLTATTDTLDVPDDGKDAVVAGANALMYAYLKRESDTAFWQNQFTALLGTTAPL